MTETRTTAPASPDPLASSRARDAQLALHTLLARAYASLGRDDDALAQVELGLAQAGSDSSLRLPLLQGITFATLAPVIKIANDHAGEGEHAARVGLQTVYGAVIAADDGFTA